MPDDELRSKISAYQAKARELIAEHGVFLQGVFPNPGEVGPTFVYTVGLHEAGHPEIIEFGLPYKVAGPILNDLAAQIRAGKVFWPYLEYLEVVADYPVIFIPVDDSSEHLTLANAFYGRPGAGPIPALQMVFPDMAGRFPWEEDYDLDPRTQPLLGQPPK